MKFKSIKILIMALVLTGCAATTQEVIKEVKQNKIIRINLSTKMDSYDLNKEKKLITDVEKNKTLKLEKNTETSPGPVEPTLYSSEEVEKKGKNRIEELTPIIEMKPASVDRILSSNGDSKKITINKQLTLPAAALELSLSENKNPPISSGITISNEAGIIEEKYRTLEKENNQTNKLKKENLDNISDRNSIFDKKIENINMYEARIDQLLWNLAEKLKLNLVVEPRILALPQRVSLNMKNVTALEVLDHVMNIFDLHAELNGSMLSISDMEDRVFDLNILGTKSALKIDTGGDVLGGAGKESSSAMRGNTLMTNEVGDKGDPYEYIIKAIEGIMAENSSSSATGEMAQKPRIAFDRNSGTLFVRGRPSRVKSVTEFIRRIKKMRDRQVQIDIRLIDIQLSDGYKFGIDWNLLRSNVAGLVGSYTGTINTLQATVNGNLRTSGVVIPNQTFGATNSATPGAGLFYRDKNLSAVVNALSQFGNSKVVSSPTLRVRNGIPAFMSVGTNLRYVSKVTSTSQTVNGGNTISTDVQTDSLFSGVVMGVTAVIKEDETIEIFINPTQTKVRSDSLDLKQVGTASVTLPIIDSKSVSTTLNIKNDDTVILGGLTDQQTSDNSSTVPVLSEIPFLGKLFNKKDNVKQDRELIIIFSAKII